MTKEKLLKAEYGSDKTPLRIGSIEIPCYVLEDGRRVISGRGMQNSLGFKSKNAGDHLLKILEGKRFQLNLKSKSDDILCRIKNDRIQFAVSATSGTPANVFGHEATVLIDIADLMIEANKIGILTDKQKVYAQQAEMIIRSVAKVGIIALIDEATGYQNIRAKDALQGLLDKYLLKEFAAYAKRFPIEFYQEMFRLRGWNIHNPKLLKKPSCVGNYTNDIVYNRLAPGILEELKARNPKDDKGNRKARHHQFLTEDLGHPALSQHLHTVIAFMRAATKWEDFYRMLQRALPKKNEQMLLDLGNK